MKQEETKYYNLCIRCEWRARFLETGKGPRYECGTDAGKNCCYNYLPVKPLVLQRSDKTDKRPHGTGMLSCRSFSTQIADLKLKGYRAKDNSLTLYWVKEDPIINK